MSKPPCFISDNNFRSPRTALSHFIPDTDSWVPLPGEIWVKRGEMTCPESLTLSSTKSDPELDPLIQYNPSRAWCMGHCFLGIGIPLAIPFGPACLQSGHLFLVTVVWAGQGRAGWILRLSWQWAPEALGHGLRGPGQCFWKTTGHRGKNKAFLKDILLLEFCLRLWKYIFLSLLPRKSTFTR